MMKFFALLFFAFVPYFLLAQTTQPKDDAGQMGGTSGFYETYNPVNFPAGANGWWHLLDVRHSNVNNNFAMQFAGSFFDQDLWFRKTNNFASAGWSRVLTETDGNLNRKIYMLTSGGQNFFTGHQAGGTYSFLGGIFKAITDNPNGQSNFFYEGVTAGVTNFTVRADGQGYLASGLGIGTQNPTSKLHIAGDEFITLGSYDASAGVKGIQFTGFRDVVPNYLGASIEAVPEWRCCGNYPTGGYPGIKNVALNFNVHFDPDIADSKMTALSIRSNGYVGIGSTSPTEKLTVNGKIKANEIRVDGAGAPDYVFEDGYKFATLEALESYIKANKHLPEIPSAKELERDGMAVGEMNKLLLKKIEELTLHVIEVNKRVEKLESENQKLKKNGN